MVAECLASLPVKPIRAARGALRVAVAMGLAAALACATGPAAPAPWQASAPALVWPGPPDPPRIGYVGAIHSAADLGRGNGFWRRLLSLVLGEVQTAMVKPVSVAKNGAGLLVVADPGIPTVHFFDLERRRYARLSRNLARRLRSPVGVAVEESGRVYVSDSTLGRVLAFDGPGRLAFVLGEASLSRPTGLAFDAERGRLYVVDTLASQVVAFDRAGNEVARFGGRGVAPGEFNFPTYVAVGPDGTLGVSDSLNFRVQTFRPDGTPLAAFGRPGDGAGDFARPKGVATDGAGRLFVVDAAFENVQIFAPDGTLLLVFGGAGTGPGEFTLPGGLFLDSSGTIWVADSFNGRVQAFRLIASE